MNRSFPNPEAVMRRALELAASRRGYVEPNPPVGAVVVDGDLNMLAEGCHEQFGGPHAEVNALQQLSEVPPDATMYVTLEPCCHHGKTPPCADALVDAGIRRVVVATADPAPHVDGGGIERLRRAGIAVELGLLAEPARRLIAPFTTLVRDRRPYVHAKWAMTLDGKIAAHTGSSRWISSAESRAMVHRLRGRCDAVLVGAATARTDDPLLTARPPGPRIPARIVVDSHAAIPCDSQLVRTVDQGPVLVFAGQHANAQNVKQLRAAGIEVCVADTHTADEQGRFAIPALLRELGTRQMTNLLVEGGGEILGAFFDAELIDELHVFVAPKLVGGADAPGPVGGAGLHAIPQAAQLVDVSCTNSGDDWLIHGYWNRDLL